MNWTLIQGLLSIDVAVTEYRPLWRMVREGPTADQHRIRHPERGHVSIPPLSVLALCKMDGARHRSPSGVCARGGHHRRLARHRTDLWIQRHVATGDQYWYGFYWDYQQRTTSFYVGKDRDIDVAWPAAEQAIKSLGGRAGK